MRRALATAVTVLALLVASLLPAACGSGDDPAVEPADDGSSETTTSTLPGDG